jgi:predicted TIM-barrel fold metal-dependent hydrolase
MNWKFQSRAVVAVFFMCAVQAAIAQVYTGPIIDAHAHLRLGEQDGLMPSHPMGTDALRALDNSAGVAQSALIVIAQRGVPALTREQNDAVIATAAASGGRFYPVVSVHPADGEAALVELERLAKRGVREVKLHPNTQNFDVADPTVAAVVKKCGELGLVVLFDSYKPWDSNQMGKFVILAVQHPDTRIVLAHMGFSQFREAVTFGQLKKLGRSNNVWFDISAIATTYAGSPVEAELVWTMRTVGIDHILFGSDWPVDTPALAALAVRRLGLTPSEQRQVFHDNAVQLLGLDAKSIP